jgi:hypothetical protein
LAGFGTFKGFFLSETDKIAVFKKNSFVQKAATEGGDKMTFLIFLK